MKLRELSDDIARGAVLIGGVAVILVVASRLGCSQVPFTGISTVPEEPNEAELEIHYSRMQCKSFCKRFRHVAGDIYRNENESLSCGCEDGLILPSSAVEKVLHDGH